MDDIEKVYRKSAAKREKDAHAAQKKGDWKKAEELFRMASLSALEYSRKEGYRLKKLSKKAYFYKGEAAKTTDDFFRSRLPGKKADLKEELSKRGLEMAWTELGIALAQAPRLASAVRQALKGGAAETSGLQASLSKIAKQVTVANKEYQGLHREFTKYTK